MKIRSVVLRKVANRVTDKQTDKHKRRALHNVLGGGNEYKHKPTA